MGKRQRFNFRKNGGVDSTVNKVVEGNPSKIHWVDCGPCGDVRIAVFEKIDHDAWKVKSRDLREGEQIYRDASVGDVIRNCIRKTFEAMVNDSHNTPKPMTVRAPDGHVVLEWTQEMVDSVKPLTIEELYSNITGALIVVG